MCVGVVCLAWFGQACFVLRLCDVWCRVVCFVELFCLGLIWFALVVFVWFDVVCFAMACLFCVWFGVGLIGLSVCSDLVCFVWFVLI